MAGKQQAFNANGTKECRHGEEGIENETNAALEGIRSLFKEAGLGMPEIALQWILAYPALTYTLVGSRNIQELEANVKAIPEPLSDYIKNKLDHITSLVMEKLVNHFDYNKSAVNVGI